MISRSLIALAMLYMIVLAPCTVSAQMSLVPQLSGTAKALAVRESTRRNLVITLDDRGIVRIWAKKGGELMASLSAKSGCYIAIEVRDDVLVAATDMNNLEEYSLNSLSQTGGTTLGIDRSVKADGGTDIIAGIPTVLNAITFFKNSNAIAVALGNKIIVSAVQNPGEALKNNSKEAFVEIQMNGYVRKMVSGSSPDTILAGTGRSFYLIDCNGNILRRISHTSRFVDFTLDADNKSVIIWDESNHLVSYSITSGLLQSDVSLAINAGYLSFETNADTIFLAGDNSYITYSLARKQISGNGTIQGVFGVVADRYAGKAVWFDNGRGNLYQLNLNTSTVSDATKAKAERSEQLFVTNGGRVGVFSQNGTLNVFDPNIVSSTRLLPPAEYYLRKTGINGGEQRRVTALAQTKYGVATGYSDGTVLLSALSEVADKVIARKEIKFANAIRSISASSDGRQVVVTENGVSDELARTMGFATTLHVLEANSGDELGWGRGRPLGVLAALRGENILLPEKIEQTERGYKILVVSYNLKTRKDTELSFNIDIPGFQKSPRVPNVSAITFDETGDRLFLGLNRIYTFKLDLKSKTATVYQIPKPKMVHIGNVAITAEHNAFGEFESGISSLVYDRQGDRLIIGTETGSIRIHSVKGELEQTVKPGLGPIRSIRLMNRDSLVVDTDDGYIGFISIEKGMPTSFNGVKASLIYSSDEEWIAITPDGFFASSPEGYNNVLYVGMGAEGVEAFSSDSFAQDFRKPAVVRERLLGMSSASKASRPVTPPPHVQIVSPTAGQNLTGKTMRLTASVSALETVKAARVFVNGRAVAEAQVNAKKKTLEFKVPLYSGPNRIAVIAYDKHGFTSNPAYLDMVVKDDSARLPALYVLSVGVSNYPNLPSAWQLDYAHTDAKTMVETLRRQKGKMFRDVFDLTLQNATATVPKIENGLSALSAADRDDVILILLAGHGIQSRDGKFWFLASNASFDHPELGGLDWAIINSHLSRLKGRTILLLDACHSGGITTQSSVPNDQLAASLFAGETGGIMVFSASKGRQTSLESPDYGGGFGLFTFALTQALGPKAREADTNGNGYVEFTELVSYVSKYVDKETKGDQTPWLSRKELFGDLPVARVQ